MFRVFLKTVLSIVLLLQVSTLLAGGDDPIYTDFRPSYKQWKYFYIIDRIEYTEKNTIIFFRYVSTIMGQATYYSRYGESPWFLKNKSGGPKAFELTEIRNIKINGHTVCKLLKTKPQMTFMTFPGDVLTCQVVFERLPNTVTKVDLIEGRGQEQSTEHFNAFDLQIKPMDSDDLGDVEDMKSNIKKFEKKNKVKNPEKDFAVNNPPKAPATTADETPIEAPAVDEPAISLPPPAEKQVEVAPPPKEEEKKPEVRPEAVITFNFNEDKAEFISYDMCVQYLEYIANYLYAHPNYEIELHGYTDAIQDAEKSKKLAQERIDCVKNSLLYRGVKPEKIKTFAHGNENLKVTDRASGANRRVEAVFIKKD